MRNGFAWHVVCLAGLRPARVSTMANLTTPNLQIIRDNAKQTARLIVAGSALFTEYELSQMKIGLRFRMECRLLGDDASAGSNDSFVDIFNGDFFDRSNNVLFVFNPKTYPDGSPSSTEKYSFEATVGTNLLNEDRGRDEIVAVVTLINTYTGTRVQRRTNIVRSEFGSGGPR